MANVPLRLASAVLWPITIWTTLGHLDRHAADDYVERTSPIVAAALGFWICLAAFIGLTLTTHSQAGTGWATVADVLLYFLPVIYVIGLWMFANRDARYPR